MFLFWQDRKRVRNSTGDIGRVFVAHACFFLRFTSRSNSWCNFQTQKNSCVLLAEFNRWVRFAEKRVVPDCNDIAESTYRVIFVMRQVLQSAEFSWEIVVPWIASIPKWRACRHSLFSHIAGVSLLSMSSFSPCHRGADPNFPLSLLSALFHCLTTV